MAFLLLILGGLFLFAAAKGGISQLPVLIATDFAGEPYVSPGGVRATNQAGQTATPFLNWIVAIVFVGSIGFFQPLRGPSRLFILLIVVAMVLRNGGLFNQLQTQINQIRQFASEGHVGAQKNPVPSASPQGLSGTASQGIQSLTDGLFQQATNYGSKQVSGLFSRLGASLFGGK